jgi:non-ribosomal peptide synthetase component F
MDWLSFSLPSPDASSTAFQAAWLILVARYTGQPGQVQVAGHGVDLENTWEGDLGSLMSGLQVHAAGGAALRDRAAQKLFSISTDTNNDQFLPPALLCLQQRSNVPSPMPAGLVFVFYVDVQNSTGHISCTKGLLHDRSQVDHFMRQWQHAILSILSLPHSARILDVDCLPDSDAQQLGQWNSHMPPPLEICVHDLIAQKSKATPDKTAIEAPDGCFTYNELENFSIRVAKLLKSSGVVAGQLIPFSFQKSKWATVAMLGIMKSGAAFVPVDSGWPTNRLRSVLDQCNAPVAVASQSCYGALEAVIHNVLVLDEGFISKKDPHDMLERNTESGDFAVLPQVAGTVAYVLFTSGSTGTPKGVSFIHTKT